MSPGALERKMCSSSVEPTPSRMSTPKRAFQALPTNSGSASPAEVQMRNRVPARSSFSALVVQHRGEQRRHAEEDGRVVFVHQREHRSRRRPLGIEHRGGADRHRERQRVAEAIGEEQLCRRQADIVLANAEHLLWHRSPRSRRDWNADAARPWACRSSPTNRARTPARRHASPRSQDVSLSLSEFVGQFLVAMRILARRRRRARDPASARPCP